MKRLCLPIVVLTGALLFIDAGAGLASGQPAPVPPGHPSPITAPSPQVPVTAPFSTAVAATPSSPAVPGRAGAGQVTAADDIRDIRGPLHIPDPVNWLTYAIGACLALAAGVGAWRWFRRRKTLRAKRAYELAFERLEQARALMTPEMAEAFSVSVSSAVRAYIEDRFRVRVTRHTTEEFMARIQADPSGELTAYSDLLHNFLIHCDLAKFARCLLTGAEMKEMHRSAWDFVDRTRPRSEEETLEQGAKAAEASAKGPGVSGAGIIRSFWGRIHTVYQLAVSKKTTAGMEPGADSAVAAGGR